MNFSEESLKKQFSEKMRNIMSSSGISESCLSNLTNISQSAINRIKNGYVCPSLYQAILIAKTLEKNIDFFLSNTISSDDNLPYCPVIEQKKKKNNNEVVGFIPQQENWGNNTIGMKYSNVFNCKLLNKESIVMINIPDVECYNEGDTVLFINNKNYMIGTINQSVIKPIDNLMIKIEKNNASIVGHVLSIENTFLNDKNTIKNILSSYSTPRLNHLKILLSSKVSSSFA